MMKANMSPANVIATLAGDILAEAEEGARKFELKAGRKPHLRVLTFNCDEASKVYVRNKLRDCGRVGIDCDVVEFKATDNTSDVRGAIREANEDQGVDGVILQLPVPRHIDPRSAANALYPSKDVDGVTCENAYRLRAGDPWLEPCTPAGVMRLLHKIGAVKPGLKAVVVGRSEIVGKPMADMLQLADMTVTLCNSKTPHATLADECRRADIIVTAVGKPNLITPDMLGYGQVVIDVGITRGGDGKLHGDVAPACADCCAFLSPVPGGVGLLTRAMLAYNVVEAARWRECR